MKMTDKGKSSQASKDVARMFSGDMSSREAAEIARRQSQDPNYREDFQAMAVAWSTIDTLADDSVLRDEMSSYQPRLSDTSSSGRRYTLALAASILVAFVVGLGSYWGNWFNTDQQSQILHYITRIGEQKTLNFSDGSQVIMNTGSDILVEITDKYRRVDLKRGEVFFSVAPDPQRAFSVDVGSRVVTALGTEFNLLKEPEKFTLAVAEGVVSIHKGEEPALASSPVVQIVVDQQMSVDASAQRRVVAGTVVEFDDNTHQAMVYDIEANDRLLSWRKGFIRFDEEPLYKVVQDLNRYASRKILIEDTEVMDLKLYATFQLDRLELIPMTLEKALPVKVIQHYDRMVIVGR